MGLGSLGSPIARRIHESGYDLPVCDRDADAFADFTSRGIRTTQTAADCADLVLPLVATPEQARSVLPGKGGLAEGGSGDHRPWLP
ncbi:NAD(P)-binding domain-containing protein [Rhodococcus sp. NPDC057529]|uniref:NAD(P)-binding domain-containing protein n=1 Tax=Rhodococcus sp. NPDC057529 TaxID=3346158 RepID=UPI00366C532B